MSLKESLRNVSDQGIKRKKHSQYCKNISERLYWRAFSVPSNNELVRFHKRLADCWTTCQLLCRIFIITKVEISSILSGSFHIIIQARAILKEQCLNLQGSKFNGLLVQCVPLAIRPFPFGTSYKSDLSRVMAILIPGTLCSSRITVYCIRIRTRRGIYCQIYPFA